jgi:hypothetical protein
MNHAPLDPIDGVRVFPVPGFKTECTFRLATGLLKPGKPSRKFVTQQKNSRWIFAHRLVNCFEGCVIHNVPAQLGVSRSVRRPLRGAGLSCLVPSCLP